MKGAIEALPAAKNYSISYQTQTTLTIVEGQTLTPLLPGKIRLTGLSLRMRCRIRCEGMTASRRSEMRWWRPPRPAMTG